MHNSGEAGTCAQHTSGKIRHARSDALHDSRRYLQCVGWCVENCGELLLSGQMKGSYRTVMEVANTPSRQDWSELVVRRSRRR
eukprot:6302723-Alexandrium_andersonii.AAC.1